MSASKTIADYPDAVDRIVNKHVPPEATTDAEVQAALRGTDIGPQVTREVADGIVGSVLTEDRVIDAIEASGELPSEDEIDAITSVVDEYDMGDRVDSVSEGVENRVATVEDVESAVSSTVEENRRTGRPTLREDVESAVSGVSTEKEIRGSTVEEVAGEQAREVGAPTRQTYEQARARLATGNDQVTPAGVLGEEEATSLSGIGATTANSPAPVIRSENGDAVALTGAPTQEAGERMAESIGAEYVSINEVNESIGLDQSDGRATLTFRGRPVGEVDVE